MLESVRFMTHLHAIITKTFIWCVWDGIAIMSVVSVNESVLLNGLDQ